VWLHLEVEVYLEFYALERAEVARVEAVLQARAEHARQMQAARVRKYYYLHREVVIGRVKRWYRDNRVSAVARQRVRRANRREELRVWRARWYATARDRLNAERRAQTAARRAAREAARA
jgi:hypothetical protein